MIGLHDYDYGTHGPAITIPQMTPHTLPAN